MQYRRFGKTELQIPVISCGGMRYQQSWKDTDPFTPENQRNLEACIRRAVEVGINHIETARGYGTSEEQLGHVLPTFPRDRIIVQTKVAGASDPKKFIANFEKSMRLLRLGHVDLFAFHGVNSDKEFEWAMGCMDIAQQWKKEGRVRHIGFSTHGHVSIILKAIRTGAFEYVNLHWYWIFQENWPAIEEAARRDMGVFIISPNDKGGMLYQPTPRLAELCAPLHPMVFNGLFCLRRPEVHTLSCGVAKPGDFDIHLETARLLNRTDELLPAIEARLHDALVARLGADWVDTWREGLPEWDETPGHVNVPTILRLRNLALAFDMVEFAKMRYNLLGHGDTWFPGEQAAKVPELDLMPALARSPHAARIPAALTETHALLVGAAKKRLQE